MLRPRSIAVVGGGVWCAGVVAQCRRMGFAGPVWPVHPGRAAIAGVPAVAALRDLPQAPDAVFIGVNRHATLRIVAELRAMGAGGAVAFASGFAEARAELADGPDLQARLVAAAGAMPVLGPNCYGFINYLDGALLWPDQHGGRRCERGVAIVTQSSNMAINLTMQTRGLPLAYVVCVGNQAQLGLAQIAHALLQDGRVSALGLHVEGVGDLRAFEALAAAARAQAKPVVALKAGRSEQARRSAVSHTASLTGSDAGARALLARLGMAQVDSLTALLETLKIVHFAGPLPSNRIASMSCSGGEASLVADSAEGRGVVFPDLDTAQTARLRAVLGPRVALANPLDYHTYIWGDVDAMAGCFAAMLDGDVALGLLVVDFPRADRCDASAWECAIAAAALARARAGKPLALLATLPEALPEPVAERLIAAGLIPLLGVDDALRAIAAAARLGGAPDIGAPVLLPEPPEPRGPRRRLSEARAKADLAAHGLHIPQARRATTAAALRAALADMPLPLVLKAEGLAHKTEAGGVVLVRDAAGLAEAQAAALGMPCDSWLVEAMIEGVLAEILIGVTRDPAHGFVLTLGAGGVLAEILRDTVALLLPVTGRDVEAALDRLRLAPLLDGYRGRPAALRPAIVRAVMAVQDYVTAHAAWVEEVEINPLLCTADDAVAVDALIIEGEDP